MKKRIIITAIILAIVHFILSFVAIGISFSSGMESFDNPDYQPSAIEKISNVLAGILILPAKIIWTPWISKHMSDTIEWLLFLANSLLWGFVIAICINIKYLTNKKQIRDAFSV